MKASAPVGGSKYASEGVGVAGVNTVPATAPSPSHEVVSFAEKEREDLIVIGNREKGATARFSPGSVTANALRRGPHRISVVREPMRT